MDTPWREDPEFIAWVKDRNENLLPMIDQSAISLTLYTDSPPDAKIAVELGFSILLDKPLLFLVQKGTPIPKHLARVADHMLEVDMHTLDSEEQQKRIAQEIHDFMIRMGIATDDNDDD